MRFTHEPCHEQLKALIDSFFTMKICLTEKFYTYVKHKEKLIRFKLSSALLNIFPSYMFILTLSLPGRRAWRSDVLRRSSLKLASFLKTAEKYSH